MKLTNPTRFRVGIYVADKAKVEANCTISKFIRNTLNKYLRDKERFEYAFRVQLWNPDPFAETFQYQAVVEKEIFEEIGRMAKALGMTVEGLTRMVFHQAVTTLEKEASAAQSEPKPDTQLESKSEVKAEAQAEAQSEVQAEVKPKYNLPRSDVQHVTDPKFDGFWDQDLEPKLGQGLKPKSDTQSESKPQPSREEFRARYDYLTSLFPTPPEHAKELGELLEMFEDED